MTETNLTPDDGLKEIDSIKSKAAAIQPVVATTETPVTPIQPKISKPDYIEKKIMGVPVKDPLYMVVTPCTHHEYAIKSMTVMMEEALKTSLTSKPSLVKMLANAIYQCIVHKPEHVTDFDSFCRSISSSDQTALFFGLMHQSYGEISDITTTCPQCNTKMDIENLSTMNLMTIKEYPDNDFLTKRLSYTTESGFVISMKQTTLYDELNLYDELQNIPNTQVTELKDYLQNIDHIIHPNGHKITLTLEKFAVISELPLKEGRAIKKLFDKEYGDYGCKFEKDVQCKVADCGWKFKVEVNLFNQFFRMVQRF